jgi:hypothetical protein
MNELLDWLQDMYANDLCNGSWEHVHGFTIINIDNPGWDFRFDLGDTDIEDIPFKEVFVQNDDSNWYHCRIHNRIFVGSGGAKNLTDIIGVFKDWYIFASQIVDENKRKQ